MAPQTSTNVLLKLATAKYYDIPLKMVDVPYADDFCGERLKSHPARPLAPQRLRESLKEFFKGCEAGYCQRRVRIGEKWD